MVLYCVALPSAVRQDIKCMVANDVWMNSLMEDTCERNYLLAACYPTSSNFFLSGRSVKNREMRLSVQQSLAGA